jgi:hypothetical protein
MVSFLSVMTLVLPEEDASMFAILNPRATGHRDRGELSLNFHCSQVWDATIATGRSVRGSPYLPAEASFSTRRSSAGTVFFVGD